MVRWRTGRLCQCCCGNRGLCSFFWQGCISEREEGMIHMVLGIDMGRTKKPLGIGIRFLMHLAMGALSWERGSS